jgi:hypothetical protein
MLLLPNRLEGLVNSGEAAYHFHRKPHPLEMLRLLLFNENVSGHRDEIEIFSPESQGMTSVFDCSTAQQTSARDGQPVFCSDKVYKDRWHIVTGHSVTGTGKRQTNTRVLDMLMRDI